MRVLLGGYAGPSGCPPVHPSVRQFVCDRVSASEVFIAFSWKTM